MQCDDIENIILYSYLWVKLYVLCDKNYRLPVASEVAGINKF